MATTPTLSNPGPIVPNASTPKPRDLKLEPREMRDCLGCFPTGVAVITAVGLDGRPAGLTVNSFAAVSLDPPLILWSLRLDSRILPVFQASPGFVVNVLAADQADLSTVFAGKSQGKWEEIRYERALYGIPRLEGVHAALECEKHTRHETGDHVIFVGRPVVLTTNPLVRPLVFYRGRYREVVP
jgi:flavin reductase (DIM6/NTAB) family NADH-FMN oxidoreductase RutF